MPMSALMSVAPPSPGPGPLVTGEPMLPYGRPVRRRVAVRLTLVLGIALAAVLALLHDRVVYYRVDSGSMQPTLPIGSRVAVEPRLRPRVGDIVAFHPPAAAVPATPVCGASGQGGGFSAPCGQAEPGSSQAVFVKRIVAGPGATVAIQAGRAVVNGTVRSEPFAISCAGPGCDFPSPIRVPAGQYYVLGDNRVASDDSRYWGPVPASSIVGVLVTCGPLQTACRPRR
ncbi:MAG: signal peptidase I [Solirubrobacterales bacterium]|nr:signal peptidase I [Solirubrobacterales bacterium]